MLFALLLLLPSPNRASYRHDPNRTLIDIAFPNGTNAHDVVNFLGLPPLPNDEAVFEYWDDERLQIWSTDEHQHSLQSSGWPFSAGVDVSAVSFAEERAANYMDPTDGAPPDWGQYCGSDCMIARFTDLSKNCAFPVELQEYGKSVSGRRLLALKVGDKMPAKGPVLLGGNIHGDEPVGNQMIQRYAYETCKSADAVQKKIATETVVWYLPFFNPDGYENNRRENQNGVDLNRNFPVVKTPRAEVEVKAYMAFATKVKPSYSTMYHGGMAVAIYPYFSCYDKTIIPKCPPGDVGSNNPRQADFKTAESLYAAGMKKGGQRCDTNDCSFNVINNGGYPGSGILADWAAAHNNQVDITIEVDHTKRPSGSQLPRYYKIHKPILDDYCQLPLA